MEPKAERPPGEKLFREDALRHHLGEAEEGDVIRLSPLWTRWTYWFLLGVVISGLLYLFLGSVWIYESGPAIVQAGERTLLTSTLSGTVESVEVHPGQAVTAGQTLVRFRSEREQAELASVQREFEMQLVERLRDPSNAVAGRELQRLRAQEQLLQANLDERSIRAPQDGVVQDVRIRAGQFLEDGAQVLHLVPEQTGYTFIAMLPGHAGPQLEPEMQLRLEIVGYPYADVPTTIQSIGKQVISPAEARRFLREDIADSVALQGPVVLVQGRLPSNRFRAGDLELILHDGMLAVAEVKVRRERILHRLIPGLKQLDREGDA